MNNFMNYIQPTIVKLSDSDNIPVSLRNHYMINLNIVGIKYFQENFIITEGTGGNFVMQEKYQEGDVVEGLAWLLEDSCSVDELFDIPRAYIVITSDLIADDSLLKEYTISGLINNEVFGDGIDNFRPGHEFYVNNTLYKYLLKEDYIQENEDMVMSDYVNHDGSISDSFEELTCKEKDYSNIEYYYNKNILADNDFSEDELNNFYATFASTILKYTQIDNDVRATTKNQIYDLVLNYYANFQSDCASVALNLILNTPFGNLTGSTCGCQTSSCGSSTSTSNTMTGDYNTTSCYDLYTTAMASYLKTMLGDPDFYQDWFTINLPNGTNIPNDTLISALENLLHEFMGLGYDISSLGTKKRSIYCGCSNVTGEGYDYTKILNYLKVLNWVENCELEANINKTKIYGEAFGEILPYMQF